MALGKLVCDPSHFLDGPSDQILMVRILSLFGDVALLARYRMTTILATASTTSET